MSFRVGGHIMDNEEKLKKIPTGSILINAGEESRSMYWLKSGSMVVLKTDAQRPDKVITLGNINAGELFGELSFLDEKPRSATVKAISDCEVIEIPKKKYIDILEQQPKWMQNLISNMVERQRKTNDKVRI